jgi:hypothetical protein
MSGRPTIREAALKYVATFYVEADSYEALEAAVEYVARRLGSGKILYACGPHACFCKTELEWVGSWLTIKSCMRRAVHAAAKLLIEAYGRFGGKSIQLVKHAEQRI